MPPIRLRADSIDTWQEIYFSFYVKILEFKHYLHIPRDLIVGGRVKENVDKNQVRVFFHIGVVVDVMIQHGKVNFLSTVLIKFYVKCKGILVTVVTFLDDIKGILVLIICAFMLYICIKTIARDVAGKQIFAYSFVAGALFWSAEYANL